MEVPSKRPSLMELAVTIAPWAHIKTIRLLRSFIESKQISSQSQVLQSFDAKTTHDRESKKLIVHAFLMVSSGDFLRIDAEFILEYLVNESPVEISDEVAQAFGKMNGIHNIWPYWREYVQSTTLRLGFSALSLPLMTGASILAYYEKQISRTEESATSAKKIDSQSGVSTE